MVFQVEAGDGEENVVALPPEQMKRLEALTELQVRLKCRTPQRTEAIVQSHAMKRTMS